MARKPRGFFKASAWELEDAEEESVEIVINRSPKSFVIENGKLTGMLFDKMEYELDATGRIKAERVVGRGIPARATMSFSRSARRTPSPGSSATWASSSTSGTCRWWTRPPSSRRRRGVFFGGDAAFGPKNIIWAVEHGHQAAISIHRHCQGEAVSERLRARQ